MRRILATFLVCAVLGFAAMSPELQAQVGPRAKPGVKPAETAQTAEPVPPTFSESELMLLQVVRALRLTANAACQELDSAKSFSQEWGAVRALLEKNHPGFSADLASNVPVPKAAK